MLIQLMVLIKVIKRLNKLSLPQYCGHIALIGRPNVGKSTLLNSLLDQKISITSRKPQTTRNRILGIDTRNNYQFVYVDTPGIHLSEKSAMNKYMNRIASGMINDVDVIVFLVDRLILNEEDENIIKDLLHVSTPKILAINKIDLIDDKNRLLPKIEELSKKINCVDILPISAKNKYNIDNLRDSIKARIPISPHCFDSDQVTDKSLRFIVSELIREKIVRNHGDELPYKVAVEISSYSEKNEIIYIDSIIWVERNSQKKIIVGKSGSNIKRVGIEARRDIESMVEKKIMLKLWVKVKSGWSDNQRILKSFGFDE